MGIPFPSLVVFFFIRDALNNTSFHFAIVVWSFFKRNSAFLAGLEFDFQVDILFELKPETWEKQFLNQIRQMIHEVFINIVRSIKPQNFTISVISLKKGFQNAFYGTTRL